MRNLSLRGPQKPWRTSSSAVAGDSLFVLPVVEEGCPVRGTRPRSVVHWEGRIAGRPVAGPVPWVARDHLVTHLSWRSAAVALAVGRRERGTTAERDRSSTFGLRGLRAAALREHWKGTTGALVRARIRGLTGWWSTPEIPAPLVTIVPSRTTTIMTTKG